MEPGDGISVLSRPRRTPMLGAAALLLVLCGNVASKTYETREAALARVFGSEARIERRTLFLGAAERDSAAARGAAPIQQLRVTFYEGWRGDSLLGRAYLDTHRVRNEQETLLVVVDRDGRSLRVDILAFHEPVDYLTPPRWLRTLEHRTLSRRLRPGDQVDAISGATLSTRAVTEAVRRVMAVDAILHRGTP